MALGRCLKSTHSRMRDSTSTARRGDAADVGEVAAQKWPQTAQYEIVLATWPFPDFAIDLFLIGSTERSARGPLTFDSA